LKLNYDRRSVGQSLLVSGTHVGLMTIYVYPSDDCGFITVRLSLSLSLSLTRGWVCNLHQLLLGLARAVTFGTNSRRTRDHILLSQTGSEVRWGYFTTDGVSQYVLVSSTLVGLATRYYFLSEICRLVSVGRPLWEDDGSAICSAIAQCSESRRTRNHTLLSHLRLPQPGGPGSRIYVYPPGTGWPSFISGHWVPFTYPSGTGWSSQKSKSRYDRWPVNQYVLVPSPLGIKGVPCERISIRHPKECIKAIQLYHRALGSLLVASYYS
jgi:hypothetical protein